MQALIDALRTGNALLFVGAGVSMNVGLPSWRGLVTQLAQRVGYDPDIFSTMGDNLTLAEYYHLATGSLGELRSWMDVEWHGGDRREKVAQSEVHRLLVTLPVPLIYTTNYDRYLEWACDEAKVAYVKITNVGDLVRLPQDKIQMVKFHGDFDDDSSLVLTESSYFNRMNFESALDIKLRADLLGKTVLFVGYSLADINMRYLIFKLQRLWQESAHASVQPSSYIFLTKPNPVQEAVLKARGIEPIISGEDDPQGGLRGFLTNLHKQLQ